MKRKLTDNIGLKILAVVFAVALWIISVGVNNPVEKKHFYNVPVTLLNTNSITGQGKTYKVLDDSDKVRVTVRAPKSDLSSIDVSDITLTADVSKLSYTNTVQIDYTVDKYVEKKIENIELSAEIVQLEIENLAREQFNIEVLTNGKPADGYIAGKAAMDNNAMTVSGPESVIKQISRAVAEISLDGATNDIEMTLDIKLLNEDGKEIVNSDIDKNISTVQVQVPVLKTKEVAVNYHVTGEPKEGYGLTGEIESNCSTVMITGKNSVLKDISAIEVEDDSLDVTDATNTVTATVALKKYLPTDVSLVEDTYAQVSIVVEPLRSKDIEIPLESIQFSNMPEGFSAEVEIDEDDPQGVVAGIRGLQRDLETVVVDSIVPTVDMSQFMEGEDMRITGLYSADLSFLLPDNVELEDEVTVYIRIKRLSTD